MKIPIDVDKFFKIGDRIRLLDDYSIDYVKYLVGSEFTIIGKDDYGFIYEDEDGEKLKKIRPKYTKIITFEDAKKKSIRNDEINNIKEHLEECCKVRELEFDYRDQYHICSAKMKHTTYNYKDEYICKPSMGCINHLPDEILKNKRVNNFLRLLKTEKLKDKL